MTVAFGLAMQNYSFLKKETITIFRYFFTLKYSYLGIGGYCQMFLGKKKWGSEVKGYHPILHPMVVDDDSAVATTQGKPYVGCPAEIFGHSVAIDCPNERKIVALSDFSHFFWC